MRRRVLFLDDMSVVQAALDKVGAWHRSLNPMAEDDQEPNDYCDDGLGRECEHPRHSVRLARSWMG